MSSLGPLHRTHPKWHLGVWGVAPAPRPAPIPAPPARNDADAERPSLRVHGVARRAGDCLHRKLQKMAVRWWAGFTVIWEFLKMGDLQVSMANPILKWSNLALFGLPPWLTKPLYVFLGGGMGGGQVYTVQGCAGKDMERQTADLLHLSVSHHVSRSFLGYNKQQKYGSPGAYPPYLASKFLVRFPIGFISV